MLSIKLKGKQPLRGIFYPGWNEENHSFLKCPFFTKITAFHFSLHATKAGGEEPIFCFLCSPVGVSHPETQAVPPQTLL